MTMNVSQICELSIVVVLVVGALFGTTHSYKGTTPNIEKIFIGRCLNYQQFQNGRLFEPIKFDCNKLWSVFVSGWAYKDPRSISQNDYEPFFQLASDTNIPADVILFYSGTSGVAHEFSNQGRRFVTLEDTKIGYLVDGLNWCGVACPRSNKTCDGINYKECPHWSELPEAAAEAFWGGASAKLARSAVGEARAMITSTNPEKPAYRENSFFAKFELQSMPVDTKLKVILANEPDKEALENCNSGSLLQLKEDAAKRGISVTCEENPPDILHLMCVDHPSLETCKHVASKETYAPARKSFDFRLK